LHPIHFVVAKASQKPKAYLIFISSALNEYCHYLRTLHHYMKKRLFTILQYLFFLGLGIFLVWWSISKMGDKEWEECKQALASARYALFIPVFFILTLSHVSRAIRWRILMKPLGYQPRFINTFFAVMVGYLANLAVPRLGEVLKCTILGKYEKVPADKLVGTILVERAVDVLCLGIIFVIAIFSQAAIISEYAKKTLSDNFLKGGVGQIALKFGVLLLVTAALYLLAKWLFRRYSHSAVVVKIKSIFVGVQSGLTSIRYLENKWLFIFHSMLIWCCYVGGTYLGFFATTGTQGLPVMAAFPVLAFASIGMILTPGGIGAYPQFVMEVMLLYQVDRGIGYANGTLQWVAQGVIILVVGFVSLLLLPVVNKQKNE
jgi:glycosyltransferase 2 family protein